MTLLLRCGAAVENMGFSGVLGKPVRPQLLLRQLAACRGYGANTAPDKSTYAEIGETRLGDSGKDSRPIRVLLAEDNVVNQKVAMAMLLRLGHEVIIANNGAEAVHEVQNHEFDVVLMDIHMPEMDGLEALCAIRALDSAVSGITIIALTANAMKGDRAIPGCRDG